MQYLPLLGILIVIVGFALKWNSIGIVIFAMFVAGLLGAKDITAVGPNILSILSTIGSTFVANRNMATFILILPVVGMLEKNGLKETAAKLIMKIKRATPAAVIMAYGFLRTFLAAFNVGLGGAAGFVRPVVYPMEVGAVEKTGKKIKPEDDETLKGMGAAIENITWFFGQVLFIGGSGMLLVKGVLDDAGFTVDPASAVAAEIPVMIIVLIVSTLFFTYRSRQIMKKYTPYSQDKKKGGKAL